MKPDFDRQAREIYRDLQIAELNPGSFRIAEAQRKAYNAGIDAVIEFMRTRHDSSAGWYIKQFKALKVEHGADEANPSQAAE